MDNDIFSLKNILAVISAPLTFLLGLAGWHYKHISSKVEENSNETQKLQILVHEHNIHINHLNKSVSKLENKIDSVLEKLDSI